MYYLFQSQATKPSPTQEPSLHLDIPERTENSPQDDDCDVATPEEKLLKVRYIRRPARGDLRVCLNVPTMHHPPIIIGFIVFPGN